MKKELKLITSAILSASVFFGAVGASAFSDTSGHWAESFINEMTDAGYLSGYPDGTFDPNASISTGEYASILTRVFDLPTYSNAESIFNDVPNSAWYAPYATSFELLSPYAGDGLFEGDEPLTRFEAAFTLSALYNFEVSKSNSAADMADYDTFSSSEATCLIISTAIDNGIMSGTDRGFEPYKSLTRAELCSIIWRCIRDIGISRADGMKAALAQIIDSLEQIDSDSGYGSGGEYGPAPDNGGSANAPSSSDGNVLIRVLELVNECRAQEGLSPLEWDDELADVARKHSEDMVNRSFFNHINPDGESPFDRMKKAGISYMAAAENIAAGQRTPEAVVESWMESPGHRANILSPKYNKLGVGVAYGGQYDIYWTQCFTD